MLVLSRKEGERIVIGDNITLIISKINGNRVTIGIEAPRDYKIVRGELQECLDVPSPTSSEQDAKPARITLREFAATILPSPQRQVG